MADVIDILTAARGRGAIQQRRIEGLAPGGQETSAFGLALAAGTDHAPPSVDERQAGGPGIEEPAAPVLAVHFLGAFRVSINGIPVDTVTSRRTRNLLAYLLAHRRTAVPRDVLMEAFWPGAEPDAARNRLHVALSGVRKALRAAWPHPVIQRRFDGYQIVEGITVWSDVDQFERNCRAGRRADRLGDRETAARCYEAASQLYEGDFLTEEPYAEWAAASRESLRLQATEIQKRLMEIYIDREDYGPATLLGRRILVQDPCNEEVHRILMTSYLRSGQRHLALAQYHRLAAVLRETFQARPAAETTALYTRIRQPLRTASSPV